VFAATRPAWPIAAEKPAWQFVSLEIGRFLLAAAVIGPDNR
jgi:hypothetical protein